MPGSLFLIVLVVSAFSELIKIAIILHISRE